MPCLTFCKAVFCSGGWGCASLCASSSSCREGRGPHGSSTSTAAVLSRVSGTCVSDTVAGTRLAATHLNFPFFKFVRLCTHFAGSQPSRDSGKTLFGVIWCERRSTGARLDYMWVVAQQALAQYCTLLLCISCKVMHSPEDLNVNITLCLCGVS